MTQSKQSALLEASDGRGSGRISRSRSAQSLGHPHRPQQPLDLDQQSNLTEALARTIRLAQEDYQSRHFTRHQDGAITKHRDRKPQKIATLIGIQHWRRGHQPAITTTYRTALWNAHIHTSS